MSKANRAASKEYAEKWAETRAQNESYYIPEKYQLGIVAAYLKRHAITYTTEGEVFCYPVDILGVKRDSTIAIELKASNIGRGIEQAQRNSDFVDYSYLSVWENAVTDTLLNRVEPLDIGLIGVDETVTVYSGPVKTDKQLCSRGSVIDIIRSDVRSDPPVQQ